MAPDPYAFPWWASANNPQREMQSRASARPGTPEKAGLGKLGVGLQVAGALVGAIGDYYSAKNQKMELGSRALSMDFEANISAQNAAQAETDAATEREAGKRNVVIAGQAAGQARESQRVRTAAGGVGDSASAAEVEASMRYAQEIDTQNMTVASVREANALRRTAVDSRNRSMIAKVSASNLRRSAQSIRPGLAAATSLLGSAGVIGRYST
jgi:hypothetical protein